MMLDMFDKELSTILDEYVISFEDAEDERLLIFIIELCSGLTGIGAALTPANAVIHAVTGSANVNDSLPVTSAVLLIELSVILTIGGLIPSKKVARKDPVTVLCTE